MTPEMVTLLGQEQVPDDLQQFLQKCKDLVAMSRTQMNKMYDQWERNDMVYRGLKKQDEQDRNAEKRKEPVKFVMPISKAQISTFVSFMLEVYNQKDYFYELGGTGAEDEKPAKVGQMLLEQNLEFNNFRHQKLKQFATDIAKYGVGVIKHCWTKQEKTVVRMVNLTPPVPKGMVAPPPVMQPQATVVTEYMGNLLQCVTPFHFFPDARLPLTRFQEGEFCASEDEYSRTKMKQFQKNGEAAGVSFIPDMKKEMTENRRAFGFMNDTEDQIRNMGGKSQTIILTEVQIIINPKETIINGVPLDATRDEDVRYLVWYANDARIVRLEPYDYPYSGFGYACAQFEEDQINFINDGMADILGPMQDVIDWLINSRITSVRKVMSNFLVVDPKGIEIADIKGRKPVLRLKPAVQGMGVDKWIKQLPLQDVTTGHLQDVALLDGYAKAATGITENLLGQFASGRRSAREAMNVNSNAVARVMTIVEAVWASALLPLGRQMLDNLRAGMDEPTIVRVIGITGFQENADGVQAFMQVTPDQLVGSYDFLLFDGSLPSQRALTAQSLMELLQMISSNPPLAAILGYDPALLVAEIMELKGVRNANRFKLTPEAAQRLVGLAATARNAMAPQSAGPVSGGVNK